ncbi:hypothetical protein [Streptomyces sp. HC307]|uniref:hypothetical protein n=1 Tax=Streptomyces flavusporus TaxID=3385496 RepID=UPI003916D322
MTQLGGRMRDFVSRDSDGCRLHTMALVPRPRLVLLHGGGPDRDSLRPLARRRIHPGPAGRPLGVRPPGRTWS